MLLAGWAMDGRPWGETMVALNARGLRTVAYDRRGHGRSTDPGRMDYDLLACDLAASVDASAEPFAPGATRRTQDWLGAMVLDTSRRMAVDFQRVIAEADLTAEAAATRLPVTIVHGDRDASAPPDLTGRRYAEMISGAALVIYEGMAHGVLVTHAQRLADEIARPS